MDNKVPSKPTDSDEIVSAVFKEADNLLVLFSQLDISWQVCFEALKTPDLTQNQYF